MENNGGRHCPRVLNPWSAVYASSGAATWPAWSRCTAASNPGERQRAFRPSKTRVSSDGWTTSTPTRTDLWPSTTPPGLRISGHAVLAESARGVAELALFVHQDFRGRGVGTALVEAAVAGARQHGFRRLWLTVSTENRPALRVYEKCGFRVIPGGSSTDHEMELRLE